MSLWDDFEILVLGSKKGRGKEQVGSMGAVKRSGVGRRKWETDRGKGRGTIEDPPKPKGLFLLPTSREHPCSASIALRIQSNSPPKDVHILTPRTSEYVLFYGKRDFAELTCYGCWDWEVSLSPEGAPV